MKATWLAVANSDQFLDGLEKEIKDENDQFVKLEEEVLNFLEPYEVAKEFLSWTLTQMPNATDSDYPEAGYDDIVLEEYLTGSVIIMNLNKWINPEDTIDVDLEKRRVLAFKDYCQVNNLEYKRIFVKSTDECPKSITNDGFITFRTKSQILLGRCVIKRNFEFKMNCSKPYTKFEDFILRKKLVDDPETNPELKKESDLKKQFLNVKNELKPIAPLFASFASYKFVMNYINDAFIQSCLHEYFRSQENIGAVESRLKAISRINVPDG